MKPLELRKDAQRIIKKAEDCQRKKQTKFVVKKFEVRASLVRDAAYLHRHHNISQWLAWKDWTHWRLLLYQKKLSPYRAAEQAGYLSCGDDWGRKYPYNLVDKYARTLGAFVAGAISRGHNKGSSLHACVEFLHDYYSTEAGKCFLAHIMCAKNKEHSAKQRKRYIEEAYAFLAGAAVPLENIHEAKKHFIKDRKED